MKKGKKSFILLIGVLAAVLVLAGVGYRWLTERYAPETPQLTVEETPAQETPAQEEAAEEAPEEERIAAPDFTVLNNAGEEIHLSDFAGKPVVFNIWATWCGPCKAELPAFERMYEMYGEEIEFLMINATDGAQETVEGVKAFIEENGYGFPVYYDTELSASIAYGASAIPLTVFVLADGTLAGGYRGAISEEMLEECIQIVLEASK